jgi:hypothetical protein
MERTFKPPDRCCIAALAIAFFVVPSGARGAPSGPGVQDGNASSGETMSSTKAPVRIAYLHHSTGEAIWNGGVPEFITAWNTAHGTDYRITQATYPATDGGYGRLIRLVGPRIGYRLAHLLGPYYPWANYPYDYWNLWVAHTGASRDRGELNLDDLVKDHDVIVFKHCFPVSRVLPDAGPGNVASAEKTLANYKVQYEALRARLHQFPTKRFIVWTGAALLQDQTSPEEAERARQFFDWVKETWDEKGDNIFVWDFHALETEGGLYMKTTYADPAEGDSHPGSQFSRMVAPFIGQRIVDVIEGRGDKASITGRPAAAQAKDGAGASRVTAR